jgi:hypothetical protein
MSDNSNLIFGTKTNLALAATPSSGSYLVAYDSATGYLSQKNDQGIISKIGVAPTASGVLETFPADILVSLSPGKSFGKYVNGDTIQAVGKTAVEVIIQSLTEPIAPTVTLNSSTTIGFNQTAISNVLTYTYSINSSGATATSTTLEYRRNNTGSWTTLSTDTNLFTFTHSLIDTGFNTQTFNYRYSVIDSQGATNSATKNITPATYVAPNITFSVIAATLSSIETNSKREKGNIVSNISGLITRNSTNVGLSFYQLQYQKNGSGSWVNIGTTVSISGATAAIATTNHNDTINLSDATSIGYRVQVTDSYQIATGAIPTTSSTSLVNLLNIIFYGPTSSIPITSGDVRSSTNRIFRDGLNPFTLNTGTTYNNFVVAIPSTLELSEVLDIDALSANITGSYIKDTFDILDFIGTNVSYDVYTMTNAIPYISNHRHQVTRI